MIHSKFLVAASFAALSIPASAALTVIGASSARLCYEAAETRSPAPSALEWCDRALEEEALTRNDEVATFVNRGILKLRSGKVDESVADFDTALELDRNEPEAYLNKGMAFLHSPARAEEAIALFDEALAKKTKRPAIAHYGRAVAHEAQGRVKQAYLDYREASRLEPKWDQPKIELTRFRVESG